MEIASSLKFASDLIEYIMRKHGQPWLQPPGRYFQLPHVEKTFTDEIGQLVYLNGLLEYNGCEAVFLGNRLLGNCAGHLRDYVLNLSQACEDCFNSQTLIVFLARVTVFVVLCYKNGAFDAPSFATTAIAEALKKLEPKFLDIGGWPGLARDARFYLNLPTYTLTSRNVPRWPTRYNFVLSSDIGLQFGLGSEILLASNELS